MSANCFANKQIVILGLARQGLSLARFFTQAGAKVTISDRSDRASLAAEIDALDDLDVDLALGGHPLSLLNECDLLCLSGGVPPQIEFVQEAIRRGIPLSNDSLLTLQLAAERGLGPTVALTGSSGKTTTTTLVGKMLEASGMTVYVGGNIGTPLLDKLDMIRPSEPIVLELSSFQLELFNEEICANSLSGLGPDVAAVLNITPNHLDRHPSMAAYADAKFNLLRHLRSHSAVVVSGDDPVTQRLYSGSWSQETRELNESWQLEELVTDVQSVISNLEAPVIFFSREQTLAAGAWIDGESLMLNGEEICHRSDLKLRGEHNISNILAAAVISNTAGASLEAIRSVAKEFSGVAHRLEVIMSDSNITWINDSIATSPERALAGLRCFTPNEQAIILLVGGKDKNLSWNELADEAIERATQIIGFGQAGPAFVTLVQERAQYRQQNAPSCAVVQRLDQAVELASRVATLNRTEPTVILLSPGGTSYDEYKNFEERGEHFHQLVKEQHVASG